MEVVTQTNAVKSPTDSSATTKLVYTVEELSLIHIFLAHLVPYLILIVQFQYVV